MPALYNAVESLAPVIRIVSKGADTTLNQKARMPVLECKKNPAEAGFN